MVVHILLYVDIQLRPGFYLFICNLRMSRGYKLCHRAFLPGAAFLILHHLLHDYLIFFKSTLDHPLPVLDLMARLHFGKIRNLNLLLLPVHIACKILFQLLRGRLGDKLNSFCALFEVFLI